MATASRTFRVFICSTFSDLVAERDALQENVFPRLRELCERHGCRFQAIDLRWGVSDEAGVDQQTVRICLEEIRRCQEVSPRLNFLVLLGDRYGWRPLPAEIDSEEFERIQEHVQGPESARLLRWYRRDDNAVPPSHVLRPRRGAYRDSAFWETHVEQPLRRLLYRAAVELGLPERQQYAYRASAVEQEIAVGALTAKDAAEHVFCFIRQLVHADGVPLAARVPRDEPVRAYLDTTDHDGGIRLDQEAHELLEALKQQHLRSCLPGNIHHYSATWMGTGITADHVGELPGTLDECLTLLDQPPDSTSTLCVDIWRRLAGVVLRGVETLDQVDPLEQEIEGHEEFGRERARHFVGRGELLQGIANYTSSESRQPLIVYGPSGSGKSALVAEAVERARATGISVIARFVGATPESTEIRSLLESLCREIVQVFGLDGEVPTEYRDLVEELPKRVAQATTERPLVLMVDGLDQLDSTDNARALNWLPRELPEHAHLVASILERGDTEGECLRAAREKLPPEAFVRLPEMESEESEELLDRWLGDSAAHRVLQAPQRELVLGRFAQCPTPLYLRFVFEEVRRWRSFDGLPGGSEPESDLSDPVEGMVAGMLRRLERPAAHGEVLVRKALSLLRASRNGLIEDEMLDLLSRDEEVMRDFRRRSPRSPRSFLLPPVIWLRLYSELKPYLLWRSADQMTLLGFYHRQLGEVVATRYGADSVRRAHGHLAEYFHRAADPDGDASWTSTSPRGLSELPYHLMQAENWPEVEVVLTDLTFIAAKCAAGMLHGLCREIDLAVDAHGDRAIAQVRDALRLSVPSISGRERSALSSVYNHLKWTERLEPGLESSLGAARLALDEQSTWLESLGPMPRATQGGTRKSPFASPARLQALSPDGSILAVHQENNTLVLFDTATGDVVETRRPSAGVTALAVSNRGVLALADDRHSISVGISGRHLPGRPDQPLAFCTGNRLAAVRSDGALVVWDPATGECSLLAADLPAPLIVLSSSADGAHFIYVAGHRRQRVGIARWENGEWEHRELPSPDTDVLCAQISSDGARALVGTMNRRLALLSCTSGQVLEEVYYERRREAIVRGLPTRCVFGIPGSHTAYLGTRSGQLAAWDWTADSLARLPDYTGQYAPERLAILDATASPGYLCVSTDEWQGLVPETRCARSSGNHQGPVSSISIDHTGVVTASRKDNSVRWFSLDGLDPDDLQMHPAPTALAEGSSPGTVAIGDARGQVWLQPAHREVDPSQILMVFAAPVVSLVNLGRGVLLAATEDGRVQRVDLPDSSDVVKRRTRVESLSKIVRAEPHGLFWSLHSTLDPATGTTPHSVSLTSRRGEEEVIYTSDWISDLVASRDGSRIAVTGQTVQVLQHENGQWAPRFSRSDQVDHVVFLADDALLAVARSGYPWLEFWEITSGLPTTAEVYVPSRPTSLAADGFLLAAGLLSGETLAVRVRPTRGHCQGTQSKGGDRCP